MATITKRHLKQQLVINSQYAQYQNPNRIRAIEYKKLRQVVPSLKRQRDVDKVEVVTEAARYIEHLHKTLIERIVLCGIPESWKDMLGLDDANELEPQHIMNLVTKMFAKQQQVAAPTPAAAAARLPARRQQRTTISARSAQPLHAAQRTHSGNSCARTHNQLLQQSAAGVLAAGALAQPPAADNLRLLGAKTTTLQQQQHTPVSEASRFSRRSARCLPTMVGRRRTGNLQPAKLIHD